MFGDILSDLATELSGSLGLAGSLNAGKNHAMAQAQHGAAPDIADKNIANPISLILSSAMLLDWLGKNRKIDKLILASNLINDSVLELLKDREDKKDQPKEKENIQTKEDEAAPSPLTKSTNPHPDPKRKKLWK